MPQSMHEIVQALCDPVPTRRREALHMLENLPTDQVRRFSAYACDLQASTCRDLAAVLAHTRVPLLVDLLVDFAARPEEALREQALISLREVPAELMRERMKRLLEADDAPVRAGACDLLAQTDAQGARSDLVRTLDDPESVVVMAALGALERLAMPDTVKDIVRIVKHPDPVLRARAISVIDRITRIFRLPVSPIVSCLHEDPDPEVRSSAAVALGRHAPRGAEQVLLEAFGAEKTPAVKAAIAAAMGAYSSAPVMRELLRAKAREPDPAVVLQCRMALKKMPEELIVAELGRLLADNDSTVRMEAAAACGEFAFDATRAMLLQRLRDEDDELVVAAVVESLGHAGWPEAWPVVYEQVRRAPLIAYTAIDALAELLDHAHLEQFAALLDELEEPTLIEAVLKRLALYGRSNGLPSTMFDPMAKFIQGSSKLALLALQAIGCIADTGRVSAVARMMRMVNDREVSRAIARAAHAIAGQDLMVMYRELGPEKIDIMADIVSLLPEPGLGKEEVIGRIAMLAQTGKPDAVRCLQAIARLDPAGFAKVMSTAAPEIVEGMLAAWQGLSGTERKRTNLPFEHLFGSRRSRVRLMALTLLPVPGPDELLARTASLALTDEDEVVRRAARNLTRKMVEAEYGTTPPEQEQCAPTSA